MTGLVRFDTYLHWSPFGQGVILSLIQIGGMGIMTYAIALIALMRRKIGLGTRVVMQNSYRGAHVGGIVRMTRFILLGSLLVEGIGALLLGFYSLPPDRSVARDLVCRVSQRVGVLQRRV